MGQVTIDLDAKLEARVKASAKAMNISLSKWIANLIAKKTSEEWPDSVRRLAGSWTDFPDLEEIRGEAVEDVEREAF